jgi:hypothetical protein
MALAGRTGRRRWSRCAVVALVLAGLGLVAAEALARQRRFGGRFPIPTEQSFDGRFHFCRAAFRTGRFGRGGGWGVDYPDADVNFSIRLSELTRTQVSFDEQKSPRHFVIQLTDPVLFRCPFIMMTEPGGLFLDAAEVEALRAYLLKGGFLWADDFWGTAAWANFEQEIRKALPATAFPLRNVSGDHPMLRMQFPLTAVKQIPSINFWAGTGGGTSEWGPDSALPEARTFVDQHGRVLVLATHNTDYGDSWEREAEDPDYFYNFSVHGYAFGINVLLYAMSH